MTTLARFSVLFIVVILGIISFLSFISGRQTGQIVLISPLPKTASAQTASPNSQKEANGAKEFSPTPSSIKSAGNKSKPINILLLGLDARRGDKNPRCDAIHIFSFDPAGGKILITSVPRGILVEIPGVEKESRYLGNSCHLLGIDFAVPVIENITKIHPDYIVKVEFSQVLGILRYLGLPTTPTLQFLRSRQYPRGDYQRSHNQALFIKDMLISKLPQFARLPKPIQYLAFKMVDTDIDFDQASDLLHQVLESSILKDPNRINLVTKPDLPFSLKELHFPEDKFQNQSVWQNDSEFKNYQNNMELYLQDLITRVEKLYQANKISQSFKLIDTPFKQQLWLQIEDDGKRNLLHFNMLNLFVLTSPDRSNLKTLVRDFITEMETAGQIELKTRGEKLLEIAGL